MADWRDRRVPEFQAYLRGVLGREPTERDYAAAIMQLEQRGQGSVAVGHAFANRLATEGGDPSRHLRHYDPVALGHRWHEVTPQAIDKWGSEYDRIASGSGPLQPGQTHFFSPAGMRAYYEKDPSLVRSAVRMTVPGHGEVLVPNWATKAVAAGDFTNVNGEWFLTPNERYGQQPAPMRVASQDAEAQPGGFYGNPSAQPVAVAATSTPDSTAPKKPEEPSGAQQFADAASKAMRIASMFSPKQSDNNDFQLMPATLGQPSGALQMAAASTPYVQRADGGKVEPMPGGAGRFASPVPLVMPKNDESQTRRILDRLNGVGRMPFADGGSVDDSGMNVPETYESLLAQQRQLIEGRRVAQMFPAGTEELPLPPGMDRVETRRGVFHFDPMRISAKEVAAASDARRENEVLGLGPMSKDDVAGVMAQTGEKPVSIVERDPMGNEVRGSLATPSTVDVQADTILRTADPKNVVDVEPVEDVVAQRAMRMAKATGGGIGISSPRIVSQDQPVSPLEMDLEDRFLKELERRKRSEAQPPEERAMGGGISDTLKGIAGSGLFGMMPMAFADGVDAEDLISPMAGMMQQKARGGGIGAQPYVGPLYGTSGGRADKLPGTARSGSHVLPADIVSHMGQGNTNAGLKRLDQMFGSGPYGMKVRQSRRRADGGGVDDEIPVMLSDGEYVIAPEMVAQIGNGDVQAGHDILDQWIMHERQNAINTLASLPPPATD